MRQPLYLPFAFAGAFALLTALPASAQNAAADAAQPPKLEKLEEGEAPAITIRQPSTASEITERRGPGGELQEIKVKSGGSTYYLRPRQATGMPVSDSIVVPQWVIIEFDGSLPKRQEERPQPQVLEPAPQK